jgi:hypothetical protein
VDGELHRRLWTGASTSKLESMVDEVVSGATTPRKASLEILSTMEDIEGK